MATIGEEGGGLVSGVDLYYRRVHLGLSKVVAFMEGCPHVMDGLYEGSHCTY